MDVAFREIRHGGESHEKNLWFATALLFVVVLVVVTRRAVQKLLRIQLTDKALSL